MSAVPDVTVAPGARRPLFTVATLATYLAVSERTVREWIAAGKIRSFKLEGSRRIDPDEVDAWLRSKREAADA